MRNDFEKDARLDFSETEWNGLVIAGDAAAGVSFAANSIVLFIHAFMLWCRPVVVARLSLRMIVLSCLFNMVYCACQLVTDGIDSTNFFLPYFGLRFDCIGYNGMHVFGSCRVEFGHDICIKSIKIHQARVILLWHYWIFRILGGHCPYSHQQKDVNHERMQLAGKLFFIF